MGCRTSSSHVRDENISAMTLHSQNRTKVGTVKSNLHDNGTERNGVNNASTCSNSLQSRNLGKTEPFTSFVQTYPEIHFDKSIRESIEKNVSDRLVASQ
jgi:hypothetical protein